MSAEREEEAKGEQEYGDLMSTELDRALRDVIPKTRTLPTTSTGEFNDAGSTESFTTDRTARYIAHGCTGHIESVSIFCKNTGAAGYIYVGFRPYPDADDQFTKLLDVPAGSPAQWKSWNIRKSWNMSRMFIHIISVDTGISVGYDKEAEYDSYAYDSSAREWYKNDTRLYIRVTLSALMKRATPVEVITPIKIDEMLGRGMTVDVINRPSAGTGKAVFIETFSDHPLKWEIIGGSTLGKIERVINASFLGEGCLYLETAAVADTFVGVGKYGVLRSLSNYGVESVFTLGDAGELYFTIEIWKTNSNKIGSFVRYNKATSYWQLTEDLVTWIDVLYQPINSGAYWNWFKYTCDLKEGRYGTLKAGDKVVDLSQYDLWTEAGTLPQQFNMQIKLYTRANAAYSSYIGYVVVTEE